MILRGRPFARPLRWLGLATVAGLGAFHADLLLRRIADSSLGEPGVALRWLVTAVVLAGLAMLRSRGVPLFRDRRAMILWLAALVLHLGATPAVALAPEWLALPAVAALGVAGAELFARALAGRAKLALLTPDRPRRRDRVATSPRRIHRRIPAFLPRPPPAFG